MNSLRAFLATFVIRLVCAIFCGLMILGRKKFYNSKGYKFVLLSIFLVILIETTLNSLSTELGEISNVSDFDLLLSLICLMNISFFFFYEVCLIIFLQVLLWIMIRVNYKSENLFIQLITILFIAISNLWFMREKSAHRVSSFNSLRKSLAINSQRNILMRNLLPSHVIDDLFFVF